MENLENYGVVSLDTKEMQETEGGNPWAIFAAGLVLGAIISDWAGFKNGIMDGIADNQ